jgi:ADP-ribosylglycohydrolase
MLGAIIGDIVGSVYEWHNIKTKDFPLFRDDCFFTDDTVMTIATAEAIMNGGEKDDFIDAYKKWGRLYPNSGYGSGFGNWIHSDSREPYNSWGNGSAMRVSPCGFAARTEVETLLLAKTSASVTHDHPEGIKGAETTALAIFLARNGESIEEIMARIEADFYELNFTIDEIRPTYKFNESCQDTVPQAITAFLESTDFEDAIRNAISLGGDSDTLAAITGSIAEAAYGIPEPIKEKALTYLDEPMKDVLRKWKMFLKN